MRTATHRFENNFALRSQRPRCNYVTITNFELLKVLKPCLYGLGYPTQPHGEQVHRLRACELCHLLELETL